MRKEKDPGKVWERISHGANVLATAPLVGAGAAKAYDAVVNNIPPTNNFDLHAIQSTLQSPQLVPALISTAVLLGTPILASFGAYKKAQSERQKSADNVYINYIKNSRMKERSKALFWGALTVAWALGTVADLTGHSAGPLILDAVFTPTAAVFTIDHLLSAGNKTDEIHFRRKRMTPTVI